MAVVVPIAADYDPSGVKQATTEFQLFGRTMEKVFQDAARNARKSFDQVEAAADTTTTGLKKTAGEADRSRSVFANFAGNAAQEIPGVSAAFGPLNTAIGQFTEYAADGNIKLAQFAKTAAVTAALSGALVIVNTQLKNIAESRAFRKENVEGYLDSFRKGLPYVDALEERLKEITKIRVPKDGILGLLGGAEGKDILGTLVRYNFTTKETAALVAGGAQAINARVAGLTKLGATTQQVADIEQYLYNQLRDSTIGMSRARIEALYLGVQTEATTPQLDGLAAALGYVDLKSQDAARKLAAAEQAILDLRDTALGAVNAEFAYADAQDDVADSVARAQQARAKARKSNKPEDIRAAERAERDVTRAVLRQGEAFGELAASRNTAATGLQDSTVAAKAFEESVSKAAQEFRQGGAIRTPLEEFAASLRTTFPTDIRTRIVFDFATGSVSIGGTKGSPFGGGLFVPGVSVPTITTNNKTDVRVNVNGFIGNNVQLAEILRRVLNEGANRRASGGFFA